MSVLVLISLQGMRLAGFIVDFDLEFLFVMEMFTWLGVGFTPLIFPLAVLFALLLVLGNMASDRELMALQTFGQSPLRFARPSLIVGAVCAVLSLMATFEWGPSGNRRFESNMNEAWSRRVFSVLRAGTFTTSHMDFVIYVDHMTPEQTLERVFVHDESSFDAPVSISARQGRWEADSGSRSGRLELFDGVIVSEDPQTRSVRRIRFDRYTILSQYDGRVSPVSEAPQNLSLGHLLNKRREVRMRGENAKLIDIELSRRAAVAMLCLLVVPLAIGLNLRGGRTAKSKGLLWGISIVFSYWTIYFALFTWYMGFHHDGFWNSSPVTWFVIWLPNFLILAAGWYLFALRSGRPSTA